VLYVLQGKEHFRYTVRPIPCEIGGRAFQVCKQWGGRTEATYYVRLSAEGDTCDCPGGCYVEHCKHTSALAHFVASGELPGGAR
jgi:hypothetical protein